MKQAAFPGLSASSRRRGLVTAAGLFIVAALFLAGCEDGGGSGSDEAAPETENTADRVNLGIADRAWDPGHDDVGWCGETCVQMAMAYYGHETPQEVINEAAGSPSDITEEDMDTALIALNVSYEAWDESNHDVNAFTEWVKTALRAGHPVICGVKYYPDETPDWYVDHFVLATGFDPDGLLLNTQLDCDGQQLISYGQLTSTDDGYAFQNRQYRYFGRAILGVR